MKPSVNLKGLRLVHTSAECGIPHRLLRIPHSALRIAQRTEPFRTIRCGFRIERCGFRIPHSVLRVPRCGFRVAIFGPHSACGTKKVKIILTFQNPIESHTMRNLHGEFPYPYAECGMWNRHAGRSEKITMVPHSREV